MPFGKCPSVKPRKPKADMQILKITNAVDSQGRRITVTCLNGRIDNVENYCPERSTAPGRVGAVHDTGHNPGSEPVHDPVLVKDENGFDTLDAGGNLILPGAIDCHVHFREPGLTENADIATESRAALAGGVTAFIDMPNTVPQTVTDRAWRQKNMLAAASSVADYAFFIGATGDNMDLLERLPAVPRSECKNLAPGVKLFMGSSTGNMLLDDPQTLDRLFARVRVPIVVHAEDEATVAANSAAAIARWGSAASVPVEWHSKIRDAKACTTATGLAIALAEKHGAHLHVAHVSTAAEIDMIVGARARGKAKITCEVSPHHLMFCDEDYARLGARIKMNPAVKGSDDRRALRRAVADGIVDIVATDHAPHLLHKKKGGALKAVSGAPMIQFAMPVLLTLFGPGTAERMMCTGPAKVFNIPFYGEIMKGNVANLVIYKKEKYTVTDDTVLSKCGWAPLVGQTLDYRVQTVIMHGRIYQQSDTTPGRPLYHLSSLCHLFRDGIVV